MGKRIGLQIFLTILVGIIFAERPVSAKSATDKNPPELNYQINEGQNLNSFFRDGKVAAHLLLRSGLEPRILIAFPAGNSGVGLWFHTLANDAKWQITDGPHAVNMADPLGRPLHGIKIQANINASKLMIKQAVLSNVRFLREYQANGRFPDEVKVQPVIDNQTILFQRNRLDGAAGYYLSITILDGKFVNGTIIPGASGQITLEITAASGDTPLTPLSGSNLLNDKATNEQSIINALSFLSYKEKFLAGSWRFNTYFGRDTLMSVRLLMDVLQPAAIEAGLNSVLARLSPNGEVPHEEGVSEFAIIDNRQHQKNGDTAALDYDMVDDDFMLAPVMAEYLLNQSADRSASTQYLQKYIISKSVPDSQSQIGAALVKNFHFVVEQARAFAMNPRATNLVAVKPGRIKGDWRDSDDGLGGGIYSYNINAVFVPAALNAIARLLQSDLLSPFITTDERKFLEQAEVMASIWADNAPPLFSVTVPADEAIDHVTAYANSLNINGDAAISSIGKAPVIFHALSIDKMGEPIKIINSDESFSLLFSTPPASDLDKFVESAMRAFPAGLMTDIGMLSANPVFTDKETKGRFSKNAYHGTVVWSWQQAMFAAGLAHQLERNDISEETRAHLREAQNSLWRVIKSSRAIQNSELWSWTYDDGHYSIAPFGEASGDADESNAAQLWSTVYLSVQPPE